MKQLQKSVTWLETAIITISGPLLAISGIIAGVDLVTGGNIFRQVGWLVLVWAITLLLTLDFQVLVLGARAHQIALSPREVWHKAGMIAATVVIAGAISYVSIQMQSTIALSNSENVTIATAMRELGINAQALIWERSTLVLVLIFLAGFLRNEHAQAIAAPAIDTAQLVNELDKRLQQRLEQRIDAVYERVEVSLQMVERATGHLPAISAPVNKSLALPEPVENLEQAIYTDRFESKEQIIAAILARQPGASVEQVAQEAQCSFRTAQKWMQKFQERGN